MCFPYSPLDPNILLAMNEWSFHLQILFCVVDRPVFCSLTLFDVASNPTYFTLEVEVSYPPFNFVIFKDKDLKFGDNVNF